MKSLLAEITNHRSMADGWTIIFDPVVFLKSVKLSRRLVPDGTNCVTDNSLNCIPSML